MNGNMRRMVATWGSAPSAHFYDAGDGRGLTHNPTRDRKDIPVSEYQENDPEQIRRLITYMEQMRDDAQLIADFAYQRLEELAESKHVA